MKQEYPRWLKILVVAMLLPIGWLTYTILTTDMGLTYTLLDEGVQIEHKGFLIMLAEKKLIPYDDITDIQVLERVPKMRKLYGLDGLRTWIGDFTSPEYGQTETGPLLSSRLRTKPTSLRPNMPPNSPGKCKRNGNYDLNITTSIAIKKTAKDGCFFD
ncbi:MAG: hypothetical protein GX060_02070 [Firmicutes bacterium]|nr:hypothetical protein [Bacillota bacterium]